jgi:hypothetical protein
MLLQNRVGHAKLVILREFMQRSHAMCRSHSMGNEIIVSGMSREHPTHCPGFSSFCIFSGSGQGGPILTCIHTKHIAYIQEIDICKDNKKK